MGTKAGDGALGGEAVIANGAWNDYEHIVLKNRSYWCLHHNQLDTDQYSIVDGDFALTGILEVGYNEGNPTNGKIYSLKSMVDR